MISLINWFGKPILILVWQTVDYVVLYHYYFFLKIWPVITPSCVLGSNRCNEKGSKFDIKDIWEEVILAWPGKFASYAVSVNASTKASASTLWKARVEFTTTCYIWSMEAWPNRVYSFFLLDYTAFLSLLIVCCIYNYFKILDFVQILSFWLFSCDCDSLCIFQFITIWSRTRICVYDNYLFVVFTYVKRLLEVWPYIFYPKHTYLTVPSCSCSFISIADLCTSLWALYLIWIVFQLLMRPCGSYTRRDGCKPMCAWQQHHFFVNMQIAIGDSVRFVQILIK